MRLTLDVGCGNKPKGHVNLDRFKISDDIKARRLIKTKANIIATGEHLPFRDRSFDTVLSSHVIEHSEDPQRFLSELIRVSSRYVKNKCPHRFSQIARSPGHHKNYFSRQWFGEALAQIGVDLDSCNIRPVYSAFLNLPISICRVEEIEIRLFV